MIRTHTDPDPDPESDPAGETPLEVLPPEFHRHATAAVGKLARTTLLNERRAAAGHPPAPCQLSGEQAEALAAMVFGLTSLLQRKEGRA